MYQIRKCQTYSVTSKTQTANLDPEKFRNLSTPYEGDSEEEFVNYISGIYLDVSDNYFILRPSAIISKRISANAPCARRR